MHDFIYRIDDILISGAAAEISGHFFADLISGEFFALLQKDSRRHDKSRCTKTALNFVDRCAELLCCFCASAEEGKGRTGGTGKTFGTASDGLSSSASEIYTSDSGRNDSEAGISEDGSGLYENKTGKRQVCI